MCYHCYNFIYMFQVTWQSKSSQSQPSAADKLQSIDSSNPAFLKV